MSAATEVARVGDRVITIAELDRRLAAIRRGPYGTRLPEDRTPAGTRLRRWVAQLLASEALILHEAPDDSLPLDRAVHALFVQVTANVTVSEPELRRYYAANPDLWTRPERRTMRHAVRPTRAEAAAVRADELGEPETVARGQLSGPVEDALFAAAPGSRIGPVRTSFGWHVAVVEGVEPAAIRPFEEVRAAIHADLLAAARGTAFDDWLAARRDALVRLAPGFEHPGDPSLPDHVHRH
ncbi:peptidyl-prolyl cis-trans isomerase [Streptomyces sp. RB6PN25]|uniref:Peptidyl-prolyl cis-trans isomerase n=1 Tax=Streptomyces humicola TaxID=2953240 RepID=A0ABT1Q005_9ACTN|nr:peptidyl-prolyl cis-trans isomerase [Streptomyces humicola]MCQ4083247.1 peptidyl-prolyl cis-trans isomerase [Streptomyces humicola]